MKFYWDTAMPVCLHVVCGWFCGTRAELSSCDRDHVTRKASNVYVPGLYSALCLSDYVL